MLRFVGDIGFALRTLRKHPGFTITAVLTLALGIGATTALFSVVNAVLLQPLPYAAPDRLVRISQDMRNRNVIDFPIAPGDFFDIRERVSTLESVAAFSTRKIFVPGPNGSVESEQLSLGSTTTGLFKLLGARIEAGRDFQEADGAPLAAPLQAPGAPGPQPAPIPPAAILSHDFWQRRFGGERNILDTVVDLGGFRAQVVGILAPGFELLLPPSTNTEVLPDVWTVLRTDFATASRINVSLRVLGRLKPNQSLAAVQGELETLGIDLRRRFPIKETAGVYFRATPLADDLVSEVRPGVLALMGAVVFVLLIACANVANLMLVRATARERELAVRTALGGSRPRLVGQMLTESLTLATIGGLAGVALALLGVRLLIALAPPNLPRLNHIALDPVVLGFAALASVLSAVVFGLVPAIRASRPDVIDVLRKSGRQGNLGAGKWLRTTVVISEVALSFILLVGAGLMIRSFIALQRTDPGFNPRGVLTFLVNGRPNAPDARLAFMRDLRDRLRALPGVTDVTAASPLPLDGGPSLVRYGTEAALADPSKFQQAVLHVVLPGYFEAMQTDIIQGRALNEADNVLDTHVVVIDALLAAKTFPGESAVGKTLLVRARGDQPEPLEIVGVARHQRHTSLATEGREAFFATDGFFGFGAAGRWAVRTSGDPTSLAPAIRSTVAALGQRATVAEMRPMMFYVDRAQAPTRFALVLIGVFAAIAAILAVIGLYGVLATMVRQRTAEIGVRMAFGAGAGQVFRMMVGQGLRLSLVGLAAGLVGAYALTGVLRTLLVGVRPTDPATFVAIAAGFLLVAAVAAGVPAARAARLDPTTALRDD